jgi:hypothetical protein
MSSHIRSHSSAAGGVLVLGLALSLAACGQPELASSPLPDSSTAVTPRPGAHESAQLAGHSGETGSGATASPRPNDNHVPQRPRQSRFADGEPGPTRTPPPQPAGACPAGCEAALSGCLIKGTVTANGYKFYLLPGQPGYDAAPVDAQRGERWFCTTDEARSAGWLPSKALLPARSGRP